MRALVTPVSVDWDADGDEDLICGNTAGYIELIENSDGGVPPHWAPPSACEAEGQTIRIQAGPNGSIQGPCEAKWGYTTLSVADWNHDGRLDIVANSIWGKVVWFENLGEPGQPQLKGRRTGVGRMACGHIAAEAGLDLVDSGTRRAGHTVADNTGRDRPGSRRIERPGDARCRGLPGVLSP